MAAHLVSHRTNVLSRSLTRAEEELFESLQKPEFENIEKFMWRDVRPNCRNDSGYTALGVAAQKGNQGAAKLLIQSGSSVNAADFYGQTPLQYAAEYGHHSMLHLLMEKGADVNWTDTNKDGLSALHLATLNGNVEIVKALVAAKCEVNVKDINGVTALHCAVANSHYDIVCVLLEAHARVNRRGIKTGRTSLFIAAEVGDLRILEEVLNHGAKVNTRDEYGMSPLCAVCVQNNTEIALRLIQVGAKVNLKDATGSLPLHYVSRSGNLELMESLLNKGSEINSMNKHMESPLHLAVRMEHVCATELLVKHGCDVNVCDLRGMITPLHVAVSSCTDLDNFTSILESIIEGGCVLDTRAFISMETPLYHAINLDKTHFAIVLLQHGSDPNADCPFDITILQKACEKNIPDLTEVLLHSRIQWSREIWLDTDIHTSGINPKLLTGYAEHVPRVLLKNIDLYICLLEARRNAASLKDACRWCIRELLVNKYHTKVKRMHLPPRLQDFILMKIL